MRFTTFYKFLMIAPLSVALGWTQQSSLGEIAKQGKTGKKAKIVITDEDVLHSTAAPATQSAAAEESASATEGKPADGSADPKPKGPAAQQSKDPKVNELRQKVDKLKTAEEMYKGGLKAGQDRLGKGNREFEGETSQDEIKNHAHYRKNNQEKL